MFLDQTPNSALLGFLGAEIAGTRVLQGVEFEVEPQEDLTFEVEPHGNVDHVVGLHEVQTQNLIYYHPARDREQHLAWELFGYREDINEDAFAVATVEKIYAHESLTFNDIVAYYMDARSDVTIAMAITGSLHQSRIHNEKLVQTLLKGHSILLLKGSLSGVCDVKKNGYELSLVVGITTGALVKGGFRFEVPAHVEGAAYRY
ncbi:hypothetical protein Tco_0670274 [Tanacetum coccineum]